MTGSDPREDPAAEQGRLLLGHIDRLHTTPMGADRIRRHLRPDREDVVGYCKDLILHPECRITRKGKNWYCETGNIRITVNSNSYTIITAHIIPSDPACGAEKRTDSEIRRFFLHGDIKGAIACMRGHKEYKDILPAYTAIFEDRQYRTYAIPDRLNDILRLYQVYFRDTFYCGLPEAKAADRLLTGLKTLMEMPGAEETLLTGRLRSAFEAEGYHALFGKTQGYYGPYIWRETVPTVFRVELPDGTAEYTVNILDGFVFRGWMDYLTFGRYGTGGWTSPDGTIHCIAQAYDFKSERFLVSLLKHEAQHAADLKRFPGITPAELEYRAKLVELCYSGDPGLLRKFLSEADESKADDSHAAASAWIGRGFADTEQRSLSCIRERALNLFYAHTKEMKEKYGEKNES